jgi:16S rRNA (guanine527-N7)-methyltransferase
MNSDFSEILLELVSPYVLLTPEVVARLEAHYSLMVHWNQKINLTSIRSLREAVERHYAESLFLGASLEALGISKGTLVDIGSGAGFPGIPIGVLRPEMETVLVESHARKSVFLREATRNQPNFSVLNRRIETVAGTFDILVSRGVAWPDFREVVPKLVRAIGLLVGLEDAAEIMKMPGFEWMEPIRVPWGDRRYVLLGSST